jgi:RNA polymerase sigma-70 factor (ECF subfamily)
VLPLRAALSARGEEGVRRSEAAGRLAGERFETVITAAGLGVEWAIGLLYREFHPMLVRYLRARGALAPEEAAERVWTDIAHGLPSFSGDESSFRRWIFGSARALLLPGESSDAPTAGSGSPMTGAIGRVAGLPAAHADVLLLKALGNLDVDDVAIITGQEAGAVRLLEIDALRLLGDPATLARMEAS